jgi:coenzyme A diphosphatase NUDT7
MHQFLTGREAGGIKPVFGLTAYVPCQLCHLYLRVLLLTQIDHENRAMLIRTAIIGYGREPDFEVNPPNGPLTEERIAYEMLHNSVFREACDLEGLKLNEAQLTSLVKKGEKEREQRVKDSNAMSSHQSGFFSRL